jgi:hypothetical protein
MLNWICPGCGRECPTATRECPACAEGVSQNGSGDSSISALATAVSSVAAASMNSGQDSVSPGSTLTITAVLEPPPTAEPEPAPALDRDLDRVQKLLRERISGVQQEYGRNFLNTKLPTPQPHSLLLREAPQQPVVTGLVSSQQMVADATLRAAAQEQWDARLVEAAAGQLTTVVDALEAAQRVHAEEAWRAKADEEARRQRERRIRELEGSLSGTGPEPAHEPVRPAVQAAPPRETAWEREVARQREAAAATVAEDAALAMRVYARETLEFQAEAAVRYAHERALGAITDKFCALPEFALLSPPFEVIPVPVRIAGPHRIGLDHLKVCKPKAVEHSSRAFDFSASPPLLVKRGSQLQRERNPIPEETKRNFPLVLSGVAVVSTILVIGSFFGTGNQHADAKSAPLDASVATEAKPSPTGFGSVPPATGSGSAPVTAAAQFAKDVEVSGLRIGADVLHRSQLQYLVINHSGVVLSGLVLNIKVTSTAPGNKIVLFQVSAVVPSLGPNESKEIRTDIDGQLQHKSIPDWQYLKTEVHVTGQ